MTIEEMRTKWEEFVEMRQDEYARYDDMVNDFCNIYATSYEEYMSMWECLMDGVENEG